MEQGFHVPDDAQRDRTCKEDNLVPTSRAHKLNTIPWRPMIDATYPTAVGSMTEATEGPLNRDAW